MVVAVAVRRCCLCWWWHVDGVVCVSCCCWNCCCVCSLQLSRGCVVDVCGAMGVLTSLFVVVGIVVGMNVDCRLCVCC